MYFVTLGGGSVLLHNGGVAEKTFVMLHVFFSPLGPIVISMIYIVHLLCSQPLSSILNVIGNRRLDQDSADVAERTNRLQ